MKKITLIFAFSAMITFLPGCSETLSQANSILSGIAATNVAASSATTGSSSALPYLFGVAPGDTLQTVSAKLKIKQDKRGAYTITLRNQSEFDGRDVDVSMAFSKQNQKICSLSYSLYAKNDADNESFDRLTRKVIANHNRLFGQASRSTQANYQHAKWRPEQPRGINGVDLMHRYINENMMKETYYHSLDVTYRFYNFSDCL